MDIPVIKSTSEEKQALYFITKRFFNTNLSKERWVSQWWLYKLNKGIYEAVVGTNEQDLETAKSILSEELQK